jgi:hypothetical protein
MSIYSLMTLGQPDNQITFNDYTQNPVYRVQARGAKQFQVRDDNIPIPFESGISDFLTLLGQSLYVIQGVMYPRDAATYDSGLAKLRSVCSLDLQQADSYSTDEGYVPYTWGEALNQKTLFVKALYVQLEETTRQGYVQPFTIFCKVKDPVIYGSVLKIASTAASAVSTTSGAAKYPFKYPIVYGSTLYTVTADANNVGALPSYPFSIDVYGPVTNPKITNTKTGEFIQINNTLSSSSDHLYISYSKDSLTVTINGNSAVSNLTTDSVFFKIYPGVNSIQLSGASIGNGSYVQLTYRDSSALA